MKIRCPKCKAVARIDSAKIPPQGAPVRCPKCKTRFLLKKKTKATARTPQASRPQPPSKSHKPGVKTCANCRTLMGADAVIHFFGGRLLCEDCYTSAKESAMKTQAADVSEVAPGGPMDLSFLLEPDEIRPQVRTMKFNPIVWSIILIIGLFILTWAVVYQSGQSTLPSPAQRKPIYRDGDPYYLSRAYDFAQRIIVREQRVPSRAAWPPAEPIENYVSYLGEQRYEVQSWYELSINQGRLFRQNFVVVLIRVGDTWERETLSYYSGEI